MNKWNVLSNSNNANIAGPSYRLTTAQLVQSANLNNELRKTCTNMK
jgi:hypothetical protein